MFALSTICTSPLGWPRFVLFPFQAAGITEGRAAAATVKAYFCCLPARCPQVRDDEYVIDVQRLDGELFIFMDAAGKLLSELRL